jgi:ABC-3C protein
VGHGYPYEDLSEAQFEALVVQAARLLLGKGVQAFAAGVDGGRDARFEGLADGFPSHARPWDQITIIQAKHTRSYGYFSDPEFSGDSDSSVLSKELVRAKKLREAGALNNYLIYSNRYLTGNANETIIASVSTAVGIPSENVHLCGIEALDQAFREERRLATLAGITSFDGPLIVQSRDLAEVVEAVAAAMKTAPSRGSSPVVRTSLATKNRLNAMSQETSDRLMGLYQHLFWQIQDFLADPLNSRVRALYDDCAHEFGLKIIAHRQEHESFDKVFSYLVDLLTGRDPLLARNKRLTRAVVFYMYWNCDIGKTEETVDAVSE